MTHFSNKPSEIYCCALFIVAVVFSIVHTRVVFAEEPAEANRYKLEGNLKLPFCHEFESYLNRNSNHSFLWGMTQDDEFKDFRLPVLEDAPDWLGHRLWIQGSALHRGNNEPIKGMEKTLEQIKSDEFLVKYKTTKIDINHDGEVDNVLIRTISSHNSPDKDVINSIVIPFDSKNNYPSRFIRKTGGAAYVNGHLFLYKGRAYSMHGSKKNYAVAELGGGKNSLRQGWSICRYKYQAPNK